MLRKVKVCATSGHKYKPTPTIQLKGAYLNKFGFLINTPLEVAISDQMIIITPYKDKE